MSEVRYWDVPWIVLGAVLMLLVGGFSFRGVWDLWQDSTPGKVAAVLSLLAVTVVVGGGAAVIGVLVYLVVSSA
jgi:hypothetical protein